uniref:Pol-like protein Pol-1 n=1 Tax=Tricholoma matsutake TaxID=40145 RepID=Q9C4A7_TRIMT|nr:Pol-like protein Pol-1 [Tricholoma matsutake]
MRDRLRSTPQLRIFSQNVNRNWGYMDSILADLVEDYDLLFIQEPPWRLIRHAPSAHNREGEEVIGAPMSPNWGTLVRPSGIDSPPCVAVYFFFFFFFFLGQKVITRRPIAVRGRDIQTKYTTPSPSPPPADLRTNHLDSCADH